MDFDLSDEQRMIADTVASVLSDAGAEDVWGAIVDSGLTGMTFREDQGGAALSVLSIAPAMVELGRSQKHPPMLGGAILPGLLSARCALPGL
ncbi:MAG: hypothetical protein AAFQ28_07540, partial [Pseudomonadota bacterium]